MLLGRQTACVSKFKVRPDIPRCEVGFFIMKRLLIVRFPKTLNPENAEFLTGKIRSTVAELFIVLFVVDNIEKTEFEIVYDPHFKMPHPFEFNGEPVNEDQLKERVKDFLFGEYKADDRQFTQVDTSTSAFMEGKK